MLRPTGITQRDGEQIRRVGAVLRFLGGRGFLQSPGWVPHSPTAAPGTLFASMWPMAADRAPATLDAVAWTVVNRDAQNPHAGPAINVTAAIGKSWNYYDLWSGEKIAAPPANGQVVLSLEAAGYGAVLATTNTTDSDPGLAAFLAKMKAMQAAGGPIQKLNSTWNYLLQKRVPIAPTPVAVAPAGMVRQATSTSFMGRCSRISQLHPTPHVPGAVICSALMPIGC